MTAADPDRRTDCDSTETAAGGPIVPVPPVEGRDIPPPGTDPQVWHLLSTCRALAALPRIALQELWAGAIERRFQPGEALVRQGDPADGLLILLEGTAHAQLRGYEGDERLLGSLASGDVIGEMALVTREPRTATVIADAPVRALFVPTPVFDQLAVRHLELGIVLTELVADRLGQAAHDGFGGKKVEGFRILRCIGRGGMSVVYMARHETTGEVVALKMMSYRLIYDSGALARFHQEAAILQRLDHENIARLKRLFPAYHTYFLVMELCEGVDLQRLVSSCGPMSESQVRPILGQIARALEYIHGLRLVHRDLKPGNVMVTRQGDIKLTDFGLAVPAIGADDQTRTAEHSLAGTPAFMAPEQLLGGPADRSTDMYALGCLAYDLLTGQHLFRGTTVFELVQQKMAPQVPAAGVIGEGISTELHEFMERAVRVNPEERPASLAPLLPWAARCDPPPEGLSA